MSNVMTLALSMSFCPASRVSMLVALAMDAGWKQQIYKIHSHFAHKRLLKQFMQKRLFHRSRLVKYVWVQ